MAQVYKKVYTSFMPKLVTGLPMSDVLFITELSTNNLLPGNMQATVTSLSTPADKSSHFLSNIIKPALDSGFTDGFDKLLNIMEASEYLHLQVLAAEIKAEIASAHN